MGKTSQKEKRLAGRVSLALAAGMFSIAPVAHGMPTLDQVKHGGATVGPTIADPAFAANSGHTLKNITSEQDKNVIHWKDFSIAEKEHVHFDAHDYMNVVTGAATSAIDGILDGGKSVYVINPNGVIFGSTAQVNVGNLYVSTRGDFDTLEERFLAKDGNGDPLYTGSAVLPTLANNALKAEVVSLIDEKGYVAATEVVMEGRNIRFLNANALTTKNGENPPKAGSDGKFTDSIGNNHPAATQVTFRANAYGSDNTKDNYGDGYIHVGNGMASNYTAKWLNQELTNSTATRTGETNGVVNYSLIRTAAQLQGIGDNATKLSGNYMLANDIDASNMTKPIGYAVMYEGDYMDDGLPFTGKFDGMYYTVKNLSSSKMSGLEAAYSAAGLFAYTKGKDANNKAVIENVGVENATLAMKHAGGIVGYANNTRLRNVWTTGGTIGNGYFTAAGGIVGTMVGDTYLTNAYNTATVKGGGLVGYLLNSGIRNGYNIGTLTADGSGNCSGVFALANSGTLTNVFTASQYVGKPSNGTEKITASTNSSSTQKNVKVISSASDIDEWIEDAKKSNIGNTTVSSEGGVDRVVTVTDNKTTVTLTGSTWREYDTPIDVTMTTKNMPTSLSPDDLNTLKKASLPRLTSFFKGVVSTEFTYDKNGVPATTDVDSYAVKDPTTGAITYNHPSKVYNAAGISKIDDSAITLYGMGVSRADKITDNDKKILQNNKQQNVGDFALLYSDQQGYDLYGNNFTITKRSLTFSDSGQQPVFTKVYDGTPDADDAVKDALLSATSGETGFMAADCVHVGTGKLVLGLEGVSALYQDTPATSTTAAIEAKDVGENKKVTVTVEENASISLTVDSPSSNSAYYNAIRNNYDTSDSSLSLTPGTTQYNTGVITARPVLVELKKQAGINKVYDGTSDVTEDGCVGAANLTTSAIDGNANSGLVASDNATLSATSVYVDASGNETKNVAGTTGAVGVAYKNIDAKDKYDKTGNYAFYYKVGEDLVAVDDSPLTAGGSITPRTLSKDYLVLKDAQGNELGTVTKDYDGTKTKSLTGTTAAYASAQIINNTTDAGKATAKSTGTGLLATDAANMTFTSTGTATFYKADGTTETSFASDNGGANKVGYGVGITTTDASILKNYQWSDAEGDALATTVNKIGAEGSGVINKRDITVALKWDSGIDKVYDGNANVKDVDGGNAYATGNYEITSGTLATDATTSSTPTIDISGTPTYSDKNVAYDGTTPTTKTIAYTILISGDAAGNYNLNSTDSTTVDLEATGTITPAPLTVSFADTTKSYDTTAAVAAAKINPTWTGLVGGDTHTDTAITGRYAEKNAQGVYQNAADVGTYDNTVDNAAKAVEYTGIVAALGDNAKNYTINGSHYTLSNTIYGKGYITARKISLSDLQSYLNPKGNLPKTYDATANYTSDMVTANQLAASDYLQVNTTAVDSAITANKLQTGASTDIQKLINNKLTIASAIYNGTDAGSYSNVSMTFNMDGTGKTQDTSDQKYYITVGNYDFEWAAQFSDKTTGTPATTGRTGTITPKGLTVTVADASKIYDGTINVKANGVVFDASNDIFKSWFTFSGMVGNETVTLANDSTATYDNKYADADGSTPTKRITYSGLALANGENGGKASNYKIVDSTGATINQITGIGTISKRNVMLSDYGVDTATKTYDGNANVANYALTFAEDTKEGATDKSVLYADGITTNAGVISSNLTGTYLPTGSQTQGQGKDVLRDSTNRATILEKDVEYTGTALTNLYGGNYNVTLADGGTYNSTTGKLTVTGGGKINPETINLNAVTASAFEQEYNGGTAVENAISKLDLPVLPADGVLTVTGAFGDKNVGENKAVTYTISVNEDNVNSINYDIEGVSPGETKTLSGDGFKGTITAKKIKATINANEDAQRAAVVKEYDGKTNTDADSSVTTWVQANDHGGQKWIIVDGEDTLVNEDGDTETVSINTGSATVAYDSGNAGNRTVTYGGLVLNVANGDANNYQLVDDNGDATTELSGYGKITPKELVFDIANDRYYIKNDSTVNSTVSTAGVTSWTSQIIGTDDVKLGELVGVYGTWNPSTSTWTTNPNGDVKRENGIAVAQDILYTSIGLTGTDKDNYTVKTWKKDVFDKNNTKLTDTVYFGQAIQTGTIKPIALTYGANENANEAHEVWKEAGKGKVYDGKADVAGYDTLGNAVSPQDYMQIEYSLDDGTTGTLAYKVKNATYESTTSGQQNADAGSAKKLVYEVELDTSAQVLNNYDLGDDLTAYFTAGHSFKSDANYKIARRLVNVTPDTTNFSKEYDGKGNYALVTGTNTVYKNKAGFMDPTAATGLASVDVADDAYLTYTANFVKKNNNAVYEGDASVAIENGNPAFKDVQYTFTLKGDKAKNYTLDANKRDVGDGGTTLQTIRKDSGTMISPKEVKVVFKDDIDKDNFDKTYDKSGSIVNSTTRELLTDGLTNRTLDDGANGILQLVDTVDGDSVYLNTTDNKPTGKYYVNGVENAAGDTNVVKKVDTQSVYIENLNLAGEDSQNYKLTTTRLTGKGDIRQKQVTAHLDNPNVTKEYDGDAFVSDAFGVANVVVADGVIDGDNLGLGLVEPAFYYERNGSTTIPEDPTGYSDAQEAGGLGVKYLLKVDNKNYTLAKWRLDDEANGTILKRKLESRGDETRIEKTYDGTDKLGDVSSVTTGLFSNVVDKDKDKILTIADTGASHYARSDVYADAAEAAVHNAAKDWKGTEQGIKVVYELTEEGQKNYKLEGNQVSGTFDGLATGKGGYINRAKVTLTPTEVSYYPSQMAGATYTGAKASNGAAYDGAVTFGRDGNTSTAVGNYTLLGYVNGTRIGTNNTFVDGIDNYYFVTKPNSALHIVQNPQETTVTDTVQQAVIADKKFTPDDYSYNRISQDPDLTRMNRESKAAVQYAEKGVNVDEGNGGGSGLIASADIRGAGSVVNLAGAVIQTSAPTEQPEKVAAEAALPTPEPTSTPETTPTAMDTDESDISSIALENTGDGEGSQALLEILTNASRNAEKKGTSIVIDTQDEDEQEETEDEKSRRALFVDRSNIGIETLGDTVNLNQMIG